MKTTNICPKCNSSNIVAPKPSMTGTQANWFCYLPTGFMNGASLQRYICLSCGYVEQWIEKESDLNKIEQKYKK